MLLAKQVINIVCFLLQKKVGKKTSTKLFENYQARVTQKGVIHSTKALNCANQTTLVVTSEFRLHAFGLRTQEEIIAT